MVLYLVIPCYNEEAVLPLTAEVVGRKMDALYAAGRIDADSRVLLVDDGSRDATWACIQSLTERSWFAGVKLSHNVGHQAALTAGLAVAREHADAAVSLDADLQDDVEALDAFLDRFDEGCDVVYGVRSDRTTDSRLKRWTAHGFYRLMAAMGVETVYDHADYRLLSRRALEALGEYREVNLFLRGIVPRLGFKSARVYYERHERAAGTSQYPLRKMVNFAWEGITSFSVKPLRLIAAVGALIVGLSVAGLLATLIVRLCGTAVGWTAMVISLWLLGGIQLLALGVCGEYIGKIYSEVKARPRYHIETVLPGTRPDDRPS